MDQVPTPRMQQLQRLLERAPDDAFILYGLAMEYKKIGDAPKALEYLRKATEADPDHAYAYFQMGQISESSNDTAAARKAYLDGIEAAVRSNDAHARSELEGALGMIE